MKIAFVHYHLKTGGVTTVLRQQVNALRQECDCLVLTGDRASAELPCRVVEIPGLGYDRPGTRPAIADQVAGGVLDAIKAKWAHGCDVLHIHNPLIAKNRIFLKIIRRLQAAGVNLFLQVHDFAEDGRPAAYYSEPYPENCHYGVINAHDKSMLQKAGLKDAGIHHLPNAIAPLPIETAGGGKRLVLYAVRAIRRKNIGEAAVLSLFFRGGKRLAITQPPNSPADALSYRDWLRWVDDTRLPVDVAVGKAVPFPRLVGQAASMVSTSISEGFGFSFLEPWTAGKWMWGRRLPGVCTDFETNGIRLDGLYDGLDIPLAWIDRDLYAQRWRRAVVQAAARYAHPVTDDAMDKTLSRLNQSDCIDFGLLDESLQRQVGNRLIADPDARKTLVALNPWLAHAGLPVGRSRMVDHNRQAVFANYGPEQYRKRLLSIYDQVVRTRVYHRIDKRILIDAFFDLDRFPLLIWGDYEH